MGATPVRILPLTAATLLLVSAALLGAFQADAQRNQQAPVDPELPSVLIGEKGLPGARSRLQNLNGGITVLSVHDSATGWYTVAIPAVAYSFTPRYSADISMPVYFYRLAETEVTTSTPAGPGQPQGPGGGSTTTTLLQAHKFDPGDILLAGHLNLAKRSFYDTLTSSMTLPSGDPNDGLSTGRVTFDFSNRTQMNMLRSALVLDLGGGDSANLIDPLVTKDYTTLGPLAHFQVGAQVLLPFRSLFQSMAYEQLPLGDNKIYTTLRRPGYPDRTIVSGRSVSEDNGFANSLSIPLSSRLRLQGYYNRSLRLHLDTAGMGLSYFWRAQ